MVHALKRVIRGGAVVHLITGDGIRGVGVRGHDDRERSLL